GGGPDFRPMPDATQQGLTAGGTIVGVPAARRAYDEIDFAAPATGAVEATASLSQSLWTKSGRTAGRIFSFDLLQDALLWAGGAKARLSEGSAVASVRFGAGSLDGSIRYDWSLHEISAFGASAGLRLTASLPTHDLRALGGLQFSLLIDLKSLGSVAAF